MMHFVEMSSIRSVVYDIALPFVDQCPMLTTDGVALVLYKQVMPAPRTGSVFGGNPYSIPSMLPKGRKRSNSASTCQPLLSKEGVLAVRRANNSAGDGDGDG